MLLTRRVARRGSFSLGHATRAPSSLGRAAHAPFVSRQIGVVLFILLNALLAIIVKGYDKATGASDQLVWRSSKIGYS